MKRIEKNYIYNLIFTLTNILFPFIIFPYVSRKIGPMGIGKIQFIISFSQYFALFAGLGIPLYGIREVARYKDDKPLLSKAFSELIIIYTITSIILSAVYLIVISSLNYFAADRNLYLVALSLILLGFSSIDWFYSGIEEFKIISVRSVVVKILSIIAIFLFIQKPAHDARYLYIFIFSLLGNNVINLLLVGKRASFTLTGLNFAKHIKPLFYIFSTTIATSMYTVFDTVLIGFLSNTAAVGYYTSGVRLTKIFIPFITSIGAVTLPALSKGFYDKDTDVSSILQKAFDFIVFFCIPISIGCLLFAKQFIIALLGNQFLGAVVPMQILSVLPIAIGLGYFYGFQILVPANKDKDLFYSVIVGMILGLMLNFFLVPHLAATGGALANALTETIITICYMLCVKRARLFSPKTATLLRSILASLIFIPVYFALEQFHMNVVISLMLAIALCTLSYFFIQTYFFKNLLITQVANTLKAKFTSSQ